MKIYFLYKIFYVDKQFVVSSEVGSSIISIGDDEIILLFSFDVEIITFILSPLFRKFPEQNSRKLDPKIFPIFFSEELRISLSNKFSSNS
jgi:hypothetical protein